MHRRTFLAGMGWVAGAVAGAGAGCASPRGATAGRSGAPGARLDASDESWLEEFGRAGSRFFTEAAHPQTGQVLDRRLANGQPEARRVASIAATGFGLGALCVAEARGWLSHDAARLQVRRTLRHLRHELPHERGFFYHFHDWGTGERIWKCELSSIDTALLLCGVLCCRAHFSDAEIQQWATELYERVEWPWMLDGADTFSMGWTPEKGFLRSRWDHYCELMLLYLLAIGSPTHPVDVRTWRAWSRPVREYGGQRFVWSPAPLFVHQFAQAWFDFRGRDDAGVDWFANSVAATRAHLAWSLERRDRFPWWSEDLWGVTSSDSQKGYVGWGGPPDAGPLDGTIVPCAAAGSLPFLPEACLRTLRHQRARYGERIWQRYGLVDAFHPGNGWVNPDVVGIDVGISLLQAENLRSGLIWRTLERDPAVQRAWRRVGLVRRAGGAAPG
ncbi:MAG: hypothetical protein IT580_05135 [Verrucomicrobiales bacterium]|nr:hypothetical protein [Verrucomicrobiales bacterium]